MEYLSEEDYKTAEANGIPRETAYARFYHYHIPWSRERAITEPVVKVDEEKKYWRNIAVKNGIKSSLFYDRIRNGWDYERAATEPVNNKDQRTRKARISNLKYFTEEQLETAKKNGISYRTAYGRVRNYGWTAERAVTEPIRKEFRRKDYASQG